MKITWLRTWLLHWSNSYRVVLPAGFPWCTRRRVWRGPPWWRPCWPAWGWTRPGLVTNSILFCWLFKIKDRCKKSAYSTNAQSRFASVVVDGILGPSRLERHTWRCPCISVVPEATSETETRELLGGTEENTVVSHLSGSAGRGKKICKGYQPPGAF